MLIWLTARRAALWSSLLLHNSMTEASNMSRISSTRCQHGVTTHLHIPKPPTCWFRDSPIKIYILLIIMILCFVLRIITLQWLQWFILIVLHFRDVYMPLWCLKLNVHIHTSFVFMWTSDFWRWVYVCVIKHDAVFCFFRRHMYFLKGAWLRHQIKSQKMRSDWRDVPPVLQHVASYETVTWCLLYRQVLF